MTKAQSDHKDQLDQQAQPVIEDHWAHRDQWVRRGPSDHKDQRGPLGRLVQPGLLAQSVRKDQLARLEQLVQPARKGPLD